MAKAQGLSLNPATISGMCGRLKCCLRYEYDQYRELGRKIPREGAMVESPEGKGKVIGRDVLTQRVRVRIDQDRIVEFDADDVKAIHHAGRGNRGEKR
jgi:cell fate regulator YaaT (PSP1 superfamily)